MGSGRSVARPPRTRSGWPTTARSSCAARPSSRAISTTPRRPGRPSTRGASITPATSATGTASAPPPPPPPGERGLAGEGKPADEPAAGPALSEVEAARIEAAIKEANRALGINQRVEGWRVWPEADFPRTHTLKVKRDLVRAWVDADSPLKVREGDQE